jgi:division protein CdvB (Snf7/Vps24/ESCRT-III family)
MTMNRQINLPAMQKIMMEFERQSEIMEMKEETIGDTSMYLFDVILFAID